MQQVEAGRVDLDAPVTDVLPWLRVCAPDVAPSLTLRRLLTHGGGLGRTGHQDRTREEVPNPYPTRRALLLSRTYRPAKYGCSALLQFCHTRAV